MASREDEDANYAGLFLRFMGGTGMHGLPNIVNGKGVARKLFWTALLLGGLGELSFFRTNILRFF